LMPGPVPGRDPAVEKHWYGLFVNFVQSNFETEG